LLVNLFESYDDARTGKRQSLLLNTEIVNISSAFPKYWRSGYLEQ